MSNRIEDSTVLVVDDDDMNLQVARMVLERKVKCHVVLADSGSAAIEILREKKINLVLLDIMMPDFDGIETLQEIRDDDRLKDIPVMMLTASGEPGNVKKARALGVTDYIRKPFMPADLVERVTKKLEELLAVETILLVDDNAYSLKAMKKILTEHFKHEVITAASAQDAAEILRDNDVTLIIIGADMKFLDGFKLLKFVADDKKFADVPFTVTTADKLHDMLDKLANDEPVEDIEDTAAVREDKGRLANVVTTVIGYKLDMKV